MNGPLKHLHLEVEREHRCEEGEFLRRWENVRVCHLCETSDYGGRSRGWHLMRGEDFVDVPLSYCPTCGEELLGG